MGFDLALLAFIGMGLVLGAVGKKSLREAGNEGGSNGLVKLSGLMTWIAIVVVLFRGCGLLFG